MGVTFSQIFPPTATCTEKTITSQAGRVFIVTGGASGVGLELCRILYNAGGTVYMAGRSEQNAQAAMAQIKQKSPTSSTPGHLHFLMVSLDDLTTIKPCVDRFNAAESRLDVLFNNAGVSNPPQDSLSPQGHEMQMATNCLGPYLLTQLLLPKMLSTAKDSPSGSVRVVWTASIVVEFGSTLAAITEPELANPPLNAQHNYTVSKLGNWFLASELAKQVGSQGILSVVQNPGNLKTALTRHLPAVVPILASPLLYQPSQGAYTELYAGLSDDLAIGDGGAYIIPWGRKHPSPRQDLLNALKDSGEGGTGQAKMFTEYCEQQTAQFR